MQIRKILTYVTSFVLLASMALVMAQSASAACTGVTPANAAACTSIDVGALGFKIPSLGDILTFVVRIFFVIAGLAALIYLLLGAFAWITSGGDKDSITAAREKIQAAVVGLILIVAVLAIIWTLEQVVFKRRICVGLSCPLTVPGLIESTGTDEVCCVCLDEDGNLGSVIDATSQYCKDDGTAGT